MRVIKHYNRGGRKTALVPLGSYGQKGFAVVDSDDLFDLESLGLSLKWNRHPSTGIVFAPAVKASGGNVQVARVLLDLGPGENVRYLNGDPSDLRRENLDVNPNGNAIRRDRDFLTPKDERKSWGPEIEHRFIENPITAEEIIAAMTPAGGRTRDQLSGWGVPWPPPKGWKRYLIEYGLPYQPAPSGE